MVLPVDIESLRTRRLRKQVGQKTFTRGCQYFSSGRVVSARREGDAVSGTVTGSNRDDYDVKVKLAGKDGRIATSECTCPFFIGHGSCKHVVAVALAALADPTLRSAESAGWGRIIDEGEEVASEAYIAEDEPEERLVVRLDLPLMPDDVVRIRFFKTRYSKRGQGTERAIPYWQLKDALQTTAEALGLHRVEEAVAARLAGLLEEDDDYLIADEANLDIVLRALSRVDEVYLGTTDRKLHIRLDAVKPRIRIDSLKNQGLSLKVQVIVNGKRRTLDKRCRVLGGPGTNWLFDGDYTLMPMVGGPGIGPVVYGLSRKQARMPLREVPTFLERGLFRLRQLIRLEAEPGVLPDIGEVEPLLVLGEDGENLRVQLSFRYGDPVELQVFNESSPAVLRAPEGHEPLFTMRDMAAEKRALSAARDAGLPVTDHPETVLLDTAEGLTFLEEKLDGLSSHWLILGRERLQRFRAKHLIPSLRGRIRGKLDSFEVKVELVVSDTVYGLDALLQLYQSGKRYLTLNDGSLALLPDAWVTHKLKVAMELPQLLLSGGIGVVPRFHSPVLAELVSGADIDGDDEWNELAKRLGNFSGLNDEPLPETLKGELRGYQKHGFDWLYFLRDFGFHGILADDMGLGKTVQALAFLLAEKERGNSEHPTLVVCPTSVTANWIREAQRFTPKLRCVRLTGPNRDKIYASIKNKDVVVTTYALLRLDLKRLQRRKWHAIVLDEAQYIKNPASQTAIAAKKINAKHRLALTGTPLENSLLELWSVYDFLMPGFLDDQKNFQSRYVRTGAHSPDDLSGLRIKIAPFMLRRVKGEVAKELPPKTVQVITVPMAPEQQALYETVLTMSKQRVLKSIGNKGLGGSTVTILDALLKLRQVACHPDLVKLEEAKDVHESSKHEILHELLEESISEGHRALVFSQFTGHLKILRQWLDEQGIGYFYLDGRTKNRQSLVDAFNRDDGPPLFLISLKAGGTGLNLTSADYVIHMDPWWNPAVEAQATDRAHRIGQVRPVVVYKLVSEGSVEEKILELQERKKALFDAVVSTGGLGGSGLTMDDIRSIFEE